VGGVVGMGMELVASEHQPATRKSTNGHTRKYE
jgi:hypothetical protein